jgi:hypothetical protein
MLGPLEVDPSDWKKLVEHSKIFCNFDLEPNPTAWFDVLFMLLKPLQKNKHRIFILPIGTKRTLDIADKLVKLKESIVAFGYVKGGYDYATQELVKQFGMEGTKEGRNIIKEATRESESVQPDDADIQLSVAIDVKFKKPLYYIIVNRKFDYDIYKTPIENLYGLLRPFGDDENVSNIQE